MGFQQGIEILVCQHCQARHEADWHRMPVREPYSLRCDSCSNILAKGKGVKDYVALRLIHED